MAIWSESPATTPILGSTTHSESAVERASDFPMKVKHVLTSGPFMQIVYVLGDNVHVNLLQPGQRAVPFVGLSRDHRRRWL